MTLLGISSSCRACVISRDAGPNLQVLSRLFCANHGVQHDRVDPRKTRAETHLENSVICGQDCKFAIVAVHQDPESALYRGKVIINSAHRARLRPSMN